MTPIETTVLGGGLTVATESVDGAASVCFAVSVGVGSRFEPEDKSGVSHFLEHLLFRGTPTHSSSELDAAFDSMGGAVDAMTGRESTTLIARVGSGDGPRALSLLCEMVSQPLLSDVELERSVILEELATIQVIDLAKLSRRLSLPQTHWVDRSRGQLKQLKRFQPKISGLFIQTVTCEGQLLSLLLEMLNIAG